MEAELRVDTAAMQTMAGGWGVLVSDLHASASPARLGLSCQPSGAAVSAAHAAAAAFTRALAVQVRGRADQVIGAGSSYLDNEASSADELSGVEV